VRHALLDTTCSQKAIRLVQCHNTFIAFSQLSSMVLNLLNSTVRICHLSTKEKHTATTHKLTDFNQRPSLLWIAMASTSCRISDSSIMTRSRTFGVLTKRTNLQRVDTKMTQKAIIDNRYIVTQYKAMLF
jgi:hypothetical protein